jgi:hypothetical protein
MDRRTPVGSGMQQARNPSAEKAVEVVRNHEDGTCFLDGLQEAEAGGNVGGSGRTRSMSEEGHSSSEPHERRVGRPCASAARRPRAPLGALDTAKGTRDNRIREDPEDPPGNGRRSRGTQGITIHLLPDASGGQGGCASGQLLQFP